MIRLLRSTAVRLALAYGVIFILSALVLEGFFWWRTAAYLDREVDAVILADTQAIGDRLHDFGLSGAIATINERVEETADEHALYLLADPTLTPVAGNLAAWPLAIGHHSGWYEIEVAQQRHVRHTRVFYVSLPSGFRLLVGRDIEDRRQIRGSIIRSLGWTAMVAMLVAALGGMALRRAVLRRIEAINRTTNAIIQGDLTHRLPTRGSSDEFDRLTQTINGMLTQIQLLVEGVRHSSNAVAHDLRTPLAELRGRLEMLLATRPPLDAALDEVQGAVADLDRVIGIFNALLRLAEIDSGTRLAGFRDVDLKEVADGLVDFYAPLAEEKGLTLELEGRPGLIVEGDPHLLTQALGNLVDNAIKFSPPGGRVAVTLAATDGSTVRLAVADQGPGIPESERARVAERFFRGAAARGVPGTGLGLSLVAAVARQHGGHLVLEDGAPGLVASLILPARGATGP